MSNKIIFHIDLNAFFASCEEAKYPFLRGRAFVCGGDPIYKKGIISTSSYEARKYGISSAMSIKDAFSIKKDLLVVPLDFELYAKKSHDFFEYLRTYSDQILPASIDECYIDMTKTCERIKPITLAKKIIKDLLKKFSLPASIGIATTLFWAKMASDMKKPLGITILGKKNYIEILYPLKIRDFYGIGIKSASILKNTGIETIESFALEGYSAKIKKVMKKDHYDALMANLSGSSSDVIPLYKPSKRKSISKEITFLETSNENEIRFFLEEQFEQLYQQLIETKTTTKTITLKIREGSFKTVQRSFSFKAYINDYDKLKIKLEDLFFEVYDSERFYRLIGVGFSSLSDSVIIEKPIDKTKDIFSFD